MKNLKFVFGAVVVAGIAFFALKMFKPAEPVSQIPSPAPAVMVRSASPSFGNTLARVTVVEWFDPECESCRKMHPAFKKIVAQYKDQAHFVLRYMPYHQNSVFASAALEEAKEHGKFEEALDLLFEKQEEWGNHQKPQPELISTYLENLGIPKEKLSKNYLIQKHEATIRTDEADGQKAGVRGTPSFFVNGQPVQEFGESPLRAAIEQALKGGATL